MRVTVLFDNLGPYHVARLSAAASVCDVTAIELNATSADYEWHTPASDATFAQRTIFASTDEIEQRLGRRLAALNRALEETKPDVVAIPGWSGGHAFATADWCLKSNTPIVLMSESTALDERRTFWKESVKRRYVNLCTTALAGGERHMQYLVQLGMPAECIFYGYDAVDNQYFAEESERVRYSANAWRRRLSLPARYFLASARFIAKKNLPMLLRIRGLSGHDRGTPNRCRTSTVGSNPTWRRTTACELARQTRRTRFSELCSFGRFSTIWRPSAVLRSRRGFCASEHGRTLGTCRQRSNGLWLAGPRFKLLRLCSVAGLRRR